MANYSIDSAHIVRVLAQHGHTHRCVRCEVRMLVKQASNLCVHCFNDLRTSRRAEEGTPEPLPPVAPRRRHAATAGRVPARSETALGAEPEPVAS